MTELSLYRKLNKIMEEVGSLDKDKKNTTQGYEYLSESNVKHAIQPLLVKHGVLFKVDLVRSYVDRELTTKMGGTLIKTEAELKYTFIDCDSKEMLEGTFMGSGTDSGDKGIYKAITGAIKYILTSTFLIPTGDDPEDEKDEKPVASKPVYNKPYTPKAPTTSKEVKDATQGIVEAPNTTDTPPTDPTLLSLIIKYFAVAKELNLEGDPAKEYAKKKFAVSSMTELTTMQLRTIIKAMEFEIEKKKKVEYPDLDGKA